MDGGVRYGLNCSFLFVLIDIACFTQALRNFDQTRQGALICYFNYHNYFSFGEISSYSRANNKLSVSE